MNYVLKDDTAELVRQLIDQLDGETQTAATGHQSQQVAVIDVGDFAGFFGDDSLPFYNAVVASLDTQGYAYKTFDPAYITERRKKALTPGGSVLAIRSGWVDDRPVFVTGQPCNNLFSSSSGSGSGTGGTGGGGQNCLSHDTVVYVTVDPPLGQECYGGCRALTYSAEAGTWISDTIACGPDSVWEVSYSTGSGWIFHFHVGGTDNQQGFTPSCNPFSGSGFYTVTNWGQDINYTISETPCP